MPTLIARGQISITDVFDGDSCYLTNEAVVFPCNSDGSNPILTGGNTTALVVHGGVQVTPTIGTLVVSGCTATASTNVITINTVTADSGYVDIPVSYGSNLIINGDFSDGLTGWNGATLGVNEGISTATTQYGGISQSIQNPISCRNHVLYGSAWFKSDSVSNYLAFMNDQSDQGFVNHSGSNNYEFLSLIRTISSTTTSIYCKTQDARTGGWTQCRVKNMVVIDLTAMFGAGKEPTKAWCDANFAYNSVTFKAGSKRFSFSKSKQGNTGSIGATGVSFRAMGTWLVGTAYVNNTTYTDVVTDGVSSYYCKVSNTGQAVTNTTYWGVVAMQGVQGPIGNTGSTGAVGASYRNMGAWLVGTTYVNNTSYIDTTSWNGSLFSSISATNVGHQPPDVATDDTYWKCIVARGGGVSDINWVKSSTMTIDASGGIWKSGGVASTWDAQAYSLTNFTGGCVLSFRVALTTNNIMFGLNAVPSAVSYADIDYCVYLQIGGAFTFYENNAGFTGGTYAVGDIFHILYEGTTIKYYQNGTLKRTLAVASGIKLYVDSSFYTVNAVPQIYDVSFDTHIGFLDWAQDWNGLKTEIKGDYIISPKIFSGINGGTASAPILTGVALGRDVLGGTDTTIGIVGYNANAVTFQLKTDGSAVFGSTVGQQFIVNANGSIVSPIITADKINGGTLTLGGSGNVNGLFNVLNSSSQNICTINNSGVSLTTAVDGQNVGFTSQYLNNPSGNRDDTRIEIFSRYLRASHYNQAYNYIRETQLLADGLYIVDQTYATYPSSGSINYWGTFKFNSNVPAMELSSSTNLSLTATNATVSVNGSSFTVLPPSQFNARAVIVANCGLTPTYSQGQLELRSTNGDDVVLGFHRQGATACSLKHEGDGLLLTNTIHTGWSTFQAGSIVSNGQLTATGSIYNYGPITTGKITSGSGYKANGQGSCSQLIGDYDAYSTANKMIWTIGDNWNSWASHYGLAYEYSAFLGCGTDHQITFRGAGLTNARIALDTGVGWFKGGLSWGTASLLQEGVRASQGCAQLFYNGLYLELRADNTVNVSDDGSFRQYLVQGSTVKHLAHGGTYLEYTQNNNVTWGCNNFASDMRLKYEIEDTKETALNKILAINHREFKWKDSDKKVSLGYIAQELEEIEDEFVIKIKQAEDQEFEELYQIDPSIMIPYLSKSIQELKQIIDKQGERIKQLEENTNGTN